MYLIIETIWGSGQSYLVLHRLLFCFTQAVKEGGRPSPVGSSAQPLSWLVYCFSLAPRVAPCTGPNPKPVVLSRTSLVSYKVSFLLPPPALGDCLQLHLAYFRLPATTFCHSVFKPLGCCFGIQKSLLEKGWTKCRLTCFLPWIIAPPILAVSSTLCCLQTGIFRVFYSTFGSIWEVWFIVRESTIARTTYKHFRKKYHLSSSYRL